MLFSDTGFDECECDCDKNVSDVFFISFVPADALKEKINCRAKAAIKTATLKDEKK